LLLLPILVGEAVIAHDQCREAIGEGVHAGPGLCVRALVRPDDVETRVDARYGEPVECRVAESERSEVIGVGKLQSRVSFQSISLRFARAGPGRHACSPDV